MIIDPADRFDYSAIVDRKPIVWPNDARIAVWVVPNIEHYEYIPAPIRPLDPGWRIRDPWSRTPHPDVHGYGIRDYGNRVGLWRMIEVFDQHRIRCTVSLSLAVLDMFPDVRDAMIARDWELMSHGLFNTRYHWDLTEAEERAEIARAQAIHERVTGRKMAGWFSPAASFTVNTPDLVAAAGFKYLCDFYHDDQPFALKTQSGTLVSLPYSMEVNDSISWRRGEEGEDFERIVRDELDTLYAEGGRVMCIAVHPFIMGQPHRIANLDRALAYVLGHERVWCATGVEIVDCYLSQSE